VSYLREYEHITLARILFAQHRADSSPRPLRDAVALLERLLAAAQDGGRAGTVIEILALLALAYQRAGDDTQAHTVLDRALALAEPEGYVRVFAAEGTPMAALLTAALRAEPNSLYLRQLVDAASESHRQPGDAGGSRRPVPTRDGLVDPLSERELDVMRLLASDLDGPAIARQLVVSLNTVRTHTKNIYAKLGVNDRRAAVRRAHQLRLLSHPETR
jgi:LuxR family transcriptional regulator, maltose regulon positive regulatory protein